MAETLEERRATMRKVIQHIIDKRPYAELTFEERRIAKECVDKNYIEGVVLVEMITGRVVMEYRFEPRLTEEGVAFLSGNTSAEKINDDDTYGKLEHTFTNNSNCEEPQRTNRQSLFWTKAGALATIAALIQTFFTQCRG